jgi:hypothetical protein
LSNVQKSIVCGSLFVSDDPPVQRISCSDTYSSATKSFSHIANAIPQHQFSRDNIHRAGGLDDTVFFGFEEAKKPFFDSGLLTRIMQVNTDGSACLALHRIQRLQPRTPICEYPFLLPFSAHCISSHEPFSSYSSPLQLTCPSPQICARSESAIASTRKRRRRTAAAPLPVPRRPRIDPPQSAPSTFPQSARTPGPAQRSGRTAEGGAD